MILMFLVVFFADHIKNMRIESIIRFSYDVVDDCMLFLYGITFIVVYIKLGIKKYIKKESNPSIQETDQ